MAAMIEIEKVAVVLGGKTIIENVSLTASAGEVTVIVGPNGSGKSTLVKAICGDIASSGAISINGRDARRLKAWQAAELRAVLPQASALSFPFTVREVVALGLSGGRAGIEAGEAASLPERALASVDLADFGGRFYQELSGGEQQRVHLARALCQIWRPVLDGVPRWLLLDEPVSSLDIRHQLIVMELARDYARAGGGVVAVLHDLNLTAMFADRIAIMRGGRIAASGKPEKVMTDAVLSAAYECDLRVSARPPRSQPFVLPQAASIATAETGKGSPASGAMDATQL